MPTGEPVRDGEKAEHRDRQSDGKRQWIERASL
jgi:hypothetical protein